MQKQKDSETLDAFKELLNRKGLKYTFERESIYEEIQRIDKHFNADSLYERFKSRGARVARATVYRNLPLLLEAGVIQKSAGSGKRDFYEKTDSKHHHDHMVCLGCRKIIEFHSDALEEIQEKLSEEYRFKLVFHDHKLFGYCENCKL
jgi:Fur family transcriptional regulator, ferric uptake regulator